MPIVPNQQSLISTDVPSISRDVQTAGLVSDATAGLGEKAANISFALESEVKKSEAIEASSKAHFQDKFDSEDKIALLKRQFPDGYVRDDSGNIVKNADPEQSPRTITHEYRDWANSRFQDNQQSMPSSMAQDMYVSEAKPYFSHALIQVKNDELIQKTEAFKRSMEEDTRVGLDRLADIPLTGDAYDLMDTFDKRIQAQKGTLIGHQDAFNAQEKSRQEVALQLFEGKYTDILAEPKKGQTRAPKVLEALKVLRGQDDDSRRRDPLGLPIIANVMKPEQKVDAEQKLMRLMQTANKLDKSDYHLLLKSTRDELERNPKARVPFAPMKAYADQLLQNGAITPIEHAVDLGGLIGKDQFVALKNDPSYVFGSPQVKEHLIQKLSDSMKSAVSAGLGPSDQKNYPQLGAPATLEAQKELMTDAKQRNEAADKDWAKYAIENHAPAAKATVNLHFDNPATLADKGDLLKRRNQTVGALGQAYFNGDSSKIRLITEDESKQFANFVKDPKNDYGTTYQGVLGLYKADPQNFQKNLDQVIRDKQLDGKYRLLMVRAPDRVLTSEILRTIRDGGIIRKDSEQAMTGLYTANDFSTAVQNSAGPALIAMTQANQDSTIAEQERSLMREVVTTKAMDLARQDGFAHAPQQYAKEASDAFLGEHFHTLSVGGTFSSPGSRNLINVPKVIDGRAVTDGEIANFEKNRANLLQKDGLASRGVVPMGTGNVDPQKFWDQVRDTGRLTPTSDMSGYYVEYKDRRLGKFVKVGTSQKDRNGLPIPLMIPTKELLKDQAPINTGPQKGSFLERVMNMGTAIKGEF